MAAPLTELLAGHSQALYATWLWCRPWRTLFDAGEGVAGGLQNTVFAVRHLFLSHGHLDHLSGLPTLLNIRNNGLGDTTQPLTIGYPRGDHFVGLMRDYLRRSVTTTELPVEWLPLADGSRTPLEPTRSVEAFATTHAPGQLTLGYRVVEHRHRRRPELAGLDEGALRQLARSAGRDAVQEPYDHPLFVYSGDALAPAVEVLRQADVACLDATFVSAADRERPTHATFDEVVEAAAAAEVRCLVLMHLSGRYQRREALTAAAAARARHGFAGELYVLWRERLLRVDE